jgi:hypothetical protein
MKSLVVVLFFVAAAVAVPNLSSTAAAQGFDRDGCLRNCQSLRPVGGSRAGWAIYQRCMADCEREFWNEFDEKIEDLERKRDEK